MYIWDEYSVRCFYMHMSAFPYSGEYSRLYVGEYVGTLEINYASGEPIGLEEIWDIVINSWTTEINTDFASGQSWCRD